MDLDAILLGLLREPASGYDVATRLRREPHLWRAGLSQIYPALHRLEAQGLLASRSRLGARGPRRRIYELTPTGRDALASALAAPPDVAAEKLPWLARVRFLGTLGPSAARDALAALAAGLRAARDRLLATRDGTPPSALPDDPREAFFELAALDAALATAEARLAWCERTLAALAASDVAQAGSGAGGPSPSNA